MNVVTIECDPKTAAAKLKAYRRQLHRRADEEYSAAAAGYAEMAKGRSLINVGDAIRSAPVDSNGRPMLAIARADRRQVRLAGRGTFSPMISFDSSRSGYSRSSLVVEFRGNEVPGREGYALVPMVPADAREAAGNPALSSCFILWEVEAWADRRISSRPDHDPLLLKHLVGELYSILAAWDLTDLERAVMSGRVEG